VQPAAGATPILDGGTTYDSWSKTAGQTNVYDAAYTPSVCGGVWDGTTLLSEAADVAGCDATEDSFYADLAGDVLYVHITGGGQPGALSVATASAACLSIRGPGCTVTGITAQHATTGLGMAQGATGSAFKNCVSQDCRTGFSISYVAGLVEDCVANRCRTDGFNGNQAGCVATFRRCVAIDCGHSAFISGGSDSPFVLFDHCLAYLANDTGRYCTGGWGFVIETTARAEIYHCTAHNLALATSVMGRGAFYVKPAGATATVRNCIAVDCGYGYTASGGAALTADHNLAYTNSDDWRDEWSEGPTDQTADPLFADEDNHDYTLQEGSPAIGAGIRIPGISTADPANLGAYE
jgi:hypothetical protein